MDKSESENINYSADFIYKPPFTNTPPLESLESEVGSHKNIRFIFSDTYKLNIKPEDSGTCLCCDAQMLVNDLEEIDINSPEMIPLIKESLLFILNNVNWPTSNKWPSDKENK